ncbi:MAG: NTP transferase domain-containing protein [Desulfobacterota bacterium]|nr:NTP transferase domain-containing protein [Thermodesulfobacteriota bacterium]
MDRIATVILAAGRGTRMKSNLTKVLHPLLGLPMLSYPLGLSLHHLQAEKTIVVVGHQADEVEKRFRDLPIEFVRQDEPLGTGHAVLQALPRLGDFSGTILILSADVPLVKGETIRAFLDTFLGNDSTVAVLTAVVKDPTGYGRILRSEAGWLERIVEEKDATEEERLIREINAGIYCVKASFLKEGLQEIGKENAQGEYYLTDLVEVARRRSLRCSAHMVADPAEIMGVNTRQDLAAATEVLRQEKVKDLMLSGVTLIDPKSVYVEWNVEIGRDTTLGPHCSLLGKTRIGERCLIESHATLSDAEIGDDVTIRSHCVIQGGKIRGGAVVGPFAYVGPGGEVNPEETIGPFLQRSGRGQKGPL